MLAWEHRGEKPANPKKVVKKVFLEDVTEADF